MDLKEIEVMEYLIKDLKERIKKYKENKENKDYWQYYDIENTPTRFKSDLKFIRRLALKVMKKL